MQIEQNHLSHFSVSSPNRFFCSLSWPSDYTLSRNERSVLEAATAVPGVRLNPQSLEIPFNALHVRSVVLAVSELGIPQSNLVELARAQCNNSVREMWTSARQPFAYQREAAAQFLKNRSLLLAFTMGLGKSTTAILGAESVRRDRQEKQPVVIIAPRYTRMTWIKELLVMGAIDDRKEICCLETRNLKHPSWNPEAKYIFAHYDVIDAWWSRIIQRRPCCAIIDESHRIKNRKAKRSEGTMMVAGTAPYAIALTGTPQENRPSELWHQLAMLTTPQAFGSFHEFRVRYAGATFNGHGYSDTVPTHSEELQQRLEHLYIRKTEKDVQLNLPPLTREFIEVEADGRLAAHAELSDYEMRRLVQAVRENRVSEVLPVLTKLRKEVSARKLQLTVALATEQLQNSEKLVIFTWEKKTAHRISDKLVKDGFKSLCITGELDQSRRDVLVDEFQAGQHDAIVATLGALKEGVTLHAARIVIMHDLDWVPAAMRQAERRVLRIGQKRACISFWMMCKSSIDIVFAGMLASKLDSIRATLGEEVEGFEGLKHIVDRESTDRWESQVNAWLDW